MKCLRQRAVAAAVSLFLSGCGKHGPSCSAEATEQTVAGIIEAALKQNSDTNLLPGGADALAQVQVRSTFGNVRTVSQTDRSLFCRATVETHATYTGPQPEAPDEAKELAAVHDAAEAIMTAAGFTDAMKTAVRSAHYYTAPSDAGHLPVGTAVQQLGRAAIAVDAISEKFGGDQGLWAAQKTDVFAKIRAEDDVELRRLGGIQKAANAAQSADWHARRQFSGDLDYRVEVTDDGKQVVTLDNAAN